MNNSKSLFNQLPRSPPKAIANRVNENKEPQKVDIKVNIPIKIIEKL
jgi:hypothetical protein